MSRILSGRLERLTSSSGIRSAVALARGACVKQDFAQSSLLGLAPRSSWASKARRCSCWGGLFEEFYRPALLQARTNAQVVISPWSDHILEPYDPVLARAAVKAACAAVGEPVPAAPTAWRWRFAGLVLGMASALVVMFRLPELHPRLQRTRRLIVPGVLLLALGLTLATWVGVTPQLRRIPQQLLLLPVIWLALAGLNRLRMPRWILAVVTGILALGCLALEFAFAKNIIVWLFSTLMCTFVISTLLLLPALAVGRIATRGGSRRDGDIAMAIFGSYAIGQFMPLFY